MNATRSTPATEALLWFAVLGPPITWAAMHVSGIGFGLWECNAAGERTSIGIDVWTAVMTGVAGGIVVAAFAVAVLLFFATRGVGNAPPAGRIHFLAVLALTLAPIFLFIVLMSGLGALTLPTCTQS